MDLDRVLRARVKARHELLKQGYTTTVIGRPLHYTCASSSPLTRRVQPCTADSRRGHQTRDPFATANPRSLSRSSWANASPVQPSPSGGFQSHSPPSLHLRPATSLRPNPTCSGNHGAPSYSYVIHAGPSVKSSSPMFVV